MFPKFLLPTAVFRPRQPNAGERPSVSPSATSASLDEEDRTDKYLSGHVSCIRCSRCAADLCLTSQIISKGFTGRHGRAYLVSADPVASAVSVHVSSSPTESLPNTLIQKPVPRQLVTGAHTVSDITCAFCGSVLGWKYVAAEEKSQRYKVGKFILETRRITTSSTWESPSYTDSSAIPQASGPGERKLETPDESVEFDSQDEDECEDLFAGIWNPGLAIRRRSRKLDCQPSMIGLPS